MGLPLTSFYYVPIKTWKVIWMWNWVCPRLNSVQNGVRGHGTMVTWKKFYHRRCLFLIGVSYPRPIMCKEWMVFSFIVGRFSVGPLYHRTVMPQPKTLLKYGWRMSCFFKPTCKFGNAKYVIFFLYFFS